MNYRPVEIPTEIKAVFYDVYGTFRVKDKSLPFAIVHFQTDDLT
jgi:hypothetical protein